MENTPSGPVIKFFIIIPTFNAAPHLDRLLACLTTQVGAFSLRIHVQDSNSTDATKVIVQHWKTWSAGPGSTPRNIEISFRSEKDSGLYDAIDRASKLIDDEDCIMTWIGADDVLMPGALATAASIFSQRPEIQWLTGAPHVANEEGEVFTPWRNVYYWRYHLNAGHYDGRKQADGHDYGFVQQEGTFWRYGLWKKSGGINTTFKLAGDWDLWRRFSDHTELYALSFPLGCFSRRVGQKSSDMEGYYKEVDQIGYRKPSLAKEKPKLLKRYAWNHEWIVESLPFSSGGQKIAHSIGAFFRALFSKNAG